MAQIDLQDVIDEFGKYYVKGGQTYNNIKTQLFTPSQTGAFFNRRPNQGSEFRSSFASIDEVLQAFGIDFRPKSTATFKAYRQPLGEFSIDDKFVPDQFRGNWLGFLADLEEKDRRNWPVLRWYIQQLLIPKSKEDFELKAAYYGWQITGYSGTPTVDGSTFTREFADKSTSKPANASMDGIRTQIQKMVADGRPVVINTGAWSTDPVTFCTEIEDFVDAIEENLRDNLDYLFMSKTLRNRYRDGRREKYNKYYAQEEDLDEIKDTNMSVAYMKSMAGTQKVWASPAGNRVRAVASEMNGEFDIQKFDRYIKLLSDWSYVLTFEVPEFIVTNDLENTITTAEIDTGRYS